MRILIATVSAGGGHVAAAKALADAWKVQRPRDEVTCLDVLDFTSSVYRAIHHDTYLQVVEHVPELYALVFKRTDNPELMARLARFRRSFARHVNRPFVEKVQALRPHILICTHYLPAEIAGALRQRDPKFKPLVASVVTDFEAHALWMEPVIDRYCVAADETKASLVARGAHADSIAVTGIPIAVRFGERVDEGEARRRLGLRDDLPTLLLLGGGMGVGPLESALAQLDRVEAPFQTLVVTGRNHTLRKELACRDYQHPTRVLGFVSNMHELLAVADLVLSKPGGLTCSEALAAGRALFILEPIPGQESANSDYLLERGVALKVNRVEDIAPRVSRLLGSSRLADMAERARQLGRPHAAAAACQAILEAARSNAVPVSGTD